MKMRAKVLGGLAVTTCLAAAAVTALAQTQHTLDVSRVQLVRASSTGTRAVRRWMGASHASSLTPTEYETLRPQIARMFSISPSALPAMTAQGGLSNLGGTVSVGPGSLGGGGIIASGALSVQIFGEPGATSVIGVRGPAEPPPLRFVATNAPTGGYLISCSVNTTRKSLSYYVGDATGGSPGTQTTEVLNQRVFIAYQTSTIAGGIVELGLGLDSGAAPTDELLVYACSFTRVR